MTIAPKTYIDHWRRRIASIYLRLDARRSAPRTCFGLLPNKVAFIEVSDQNTEVQNYARGFVVARVRWSKAASGVAGEEKVR